MSKINLGRVILGGIIAGIIINLFEAVLNGAILADTWTSVMQSIHRPPMGNQAVVMFDVFGFVIGLTAVWTYAAMRPRFGAGVKTAIYAALVIWIVGFVAANATPTIMGVYPMQLALEVTAVGLVEIVLATIAGAWLYKEV